VQLRRVDSEQVRWLPSAGATSFPEFLFTSTPVEGFPAGHALVTVLVNGIPSVSKVIRVARDGTTTAITGHTPEPAAIRHTVVVSYAVSSDWGAPTGIVTVRDGDGNSCVGTVAEGACGLTPALMGEKTLTATYSGDVNFNGSEGSAPLMVDTLVCLPLVAKNHAP